MIDVFLVIRIANKTLLIYVCMTCIQLQCCRTKFFLKHWMSSIASVKMIPPQKISPYGARRFPTSQPWDQRSQSRLSMPWNTHQPPHRWYHCNAGYTTECFAKNGLDPDNMASALAELIILTRPKERKNIFLKGAVGCLLFPMIRSPKNPQEYFSGTVPAKQFRRRRWLHSSGNRYWCWVAGLPGRLLPCNKTSRRQSHRRALSDDSDTATADTNKTAARYRV